MASESIDSTFLCSCGKLLPAINPLKEWTQLIAFPCAKWVAESAAENSIWVDCGHTGNFFGELLAQDPEVGSLNSLLVDELFGLPKSRDSVWVLFKPEYSTVNDWDVDHPDEFARSGLVRVEVVEILAKYERNAWLRVRVLEVVRITKFLEKWPPREICAPFPNLLDCGPVVCDQFGDFAYCTATADDCFQSVVCQKRGRRWILLMHANWSYHSDYLEVGCRELSDEESLSLRLPPA